MTPAPAQTRANPPGPEFVEGPFTPVLEDPPERVAAPFTPVPELVEGSPSALTADHFHLVAHGGPDPRHSASVHRLAARVTELTGTGVTASFLEHNTPRAGVELLSPIRPAAAATRQRVTILPLLLTAGVHWKRDIPPVVGHQGSHHRLLPPLRPDVFAAAVADLVPADAGTVVLASAGSSKPEATRRFTELAEHVEAFLATTGRPVAVLVAMTPAEVAGVAGPDSVVVPVLVADGIFADHIREAAATAGARTTHVVGDTWAGATAIAATLSRTGASGFRS